MIEGFWSRFKAQTRSFSELRVWATFASASMVYGDIAVMPIIDQAKKQEGIRYYCCSTVLLRIHFESPWPIGRRRLCCGLQERGGGSCLFPASIHVVKDRIVGHGVSSTVFRTIYATHPRITTTISQFSSVLAS